MTRAAWLCLSLFACACTSGSGATPVDAGGADAGGDTSSTDLGPWSLVAEPTPEGALVAAWSDAQEWILVGGRFNEGLIATAQGGAWKKESFPSSGIFWWVHGDASGHRVVVGRNGRVAHRGGDGAWTLRQSKAHPKAQLQGVWWAEGSDHAWVVGGATENLDEAPLLARLPLAATQAELDDEWQVVALPAKSEDGASLSGGLFKVWGADASHIWAAGENGHVFFYDGTAWSHETTLPTDVVVTVSGRSADDVIAVGGRNQGVIARRQAGAWKVLPDDPEAGLFGVHMRPDGSALLVGNNGAMGDLGPTGTLVMRSEPLTELVLHGVRTSPTREIACGGSLMMTTNLKGVLLVRGAPLPAW